MTTGNSAMLPDTVQRRVERRLGVPVRGAEPVGGGCIANATRIDTDDGPFFLKWSREEAAATFPAEARGLRALREAVSPLVVPEVVFVRDREGDEPGVLVIEWVESGRRSRTFWDDFGRGLAQLHRHEGDCYGFDENNFIGRLPQYNDASSRWSDFFVTRRLGPQAEMARGQGRWRSEWDGMLERLEARIDELLPAQPPRSILHGDLWNGNFLVATDGRAALFDPAVYYGHREADLAMTELFGGFDGRFYDAYREAWPLEPGYEERREVYNLYHLINHLNHFGGSYAGRVEQTLRRFGS